MTFWPYGGGRPNVSTINPGAGQTVAGDAIFALSSTKKFDVYNYHGTTSPAVDVAGTYDSKSSGATVAAPATVTAVALAGVEASH